MIRPVRARGARAAIGWVLAAGLAAFALLTSTTLSAWTQATVQNTTNSAGAGKLAFTHLYTGGPCVGAAGVASVACAPTLGTAASPPASTTDSITNNSTVATTQSVKGVSCAPVQLANSVTAADPMLVRNSVAFQQTDKWGTTSAATFSGSGYAADVVGTTGTGLLGLLQASYSIGVWFKAGDAQGGGLISLDTSVSSVTSTMGYPMVWLDTSGKVNFAVSSTLGITQRASTNTYASGWHLAVLTVSRVVLGAVATITLYVDGASQATASGLTLLTGTSGYWHIGWADFTGLTAPPSRFFHGGLSGAFVNPSTALSGATVTALAGTASAAAYTTAVTGQSGIAALWMAGDTGTTTATATLPSAISAPCGVVNITLTFTNPSASVSTRSLGTFANNTPITVAGPAIGGTQSLTIATAQGTGYAAVYQGLHLYVPIVFTYGTSPASGWTQTLTWSGSSTNVFWA